MCHHHYQVSALGDPVVVPDGFGRTIQMLRSVYRLCGHLDMSPPFAKLTPTQQQSAYLTAHQGAGIGQLYVNQRGHLW